MATEAPKVIVIEDPAGAGVIAGDGLTTIVLGEASDGPSLNEDGVLMRLAGSDDLVRLGPFLFANPIPDMIQAFMDMAGTQVLFGRITGAGGAKASVTVQDFAGTPANTAQFEWRGKAAYPSLSGQQYRIRISRGAKSTSDTGAGRVDTKIELLDPLGNLVPGAILDEATMNPASESYAPDRWNALGVRCRMVDASPSDTYENTDEPAVGTYNFAGGSDPAAATSTERQAAANALNNAAVFWNATVGVVGWTAADINVLAPLAKAKWSTVVSHLARGATPSTAQAHADAITTSRDAVVVTRGWGRWYRNASKWIPGLAEVLAKAVLTGRRTSGSVNLTGANEAENRWLDFETVNPSEREGFAAARCNPLYKVANRYQTGVIVGDVLTLATGRYSQWGVRRADNLIVTDILEYLDNVVKLKAEYPFGPKTGLLHSPITLSTFNTIDRDITRLFQDYPATLLSGGRGTGWDWAADGVNSTDGFEPRFKLGTAPAGVARIIYLLIGRVDGRFVATQVNPAQTSTTGGEA